MLYDHHRTELQVDHERLKPQALPHVKFRTLCLLSYDDSYDGLRKAYHPRFFNDSL